ncbi:MATE family efflux transporter [uncultured Clostridium sp.]|uniref:MATE family efflux transporter n=1 Tax=uncultured Clostridium sp. TaxID=59620 RepID=UPI0025DD8DEC|nr:MATE family efflux transporter [uncultured Clostridium sp.]
MYKTKNTVIKNPLGEANINRLLKQFAVPSIIAMLVSSLYNIVDQFFIGRSVGELGNAATNISFPLSISCVAISLLFGIGGASAFNISMGMGEKVNEEKEKALFYMGNSITMLFGCGIILFLITQIFLTPLLLFFGSPENVLEHAKIYTRIVSFGFPFLIVATGGGHLIRADGRPKYTMICNLTGAAVNTVLDAVFVFGLNMGMAGAAYATIIGQFISGMMAIWFLSHCRTVKLRKKHLMLNMKYVERITSLGTAPCANQLAMMVVQIVMNKSLKYYGSLSVYGEAIPIACSGIITKINMVFFSFIIGISQGLQPIVSYNYGARQYERVKKAYILAVTYGVALSLIAFLLFQFAPRQIISVFGNGSEDYFQFAVQYFRVFLFFTFINFIQPITSNFYTAIGNPKGGVFLSLTRQIIFLLPLLIILPKIVGIDGIMYSGPIADLLAGIVAISMVIIEFKRKEYVVS